MCNAQTRSPPSTIFCQKQFNGNRFFCNYTPHIHTLSFELMEYFDIYDDHDDINYCWLVGASVKGVVKKLHHLQFLIEWLPRAPLPPCNQLTALLHKSILFKPHQSLLLHPIQPLCQLEITCLNRIHCDLASTTFVLRIRWIWLERQAHACTTVKLGLSFNFGSATPFLSVQLHPNCNLPI